jgi:hypothetical protein
LDGFGKGFGFGFRDEQVDVLGHDHVGEDLETVFAPGSFEGVFEEVSGFGGLEVGFSVVTTEGDEVVVVLGLVSLEPVRHGRILSGGFGGFRLGFVAGGGRQFGLRRCGAHLSDDEAVAKMGHPAGGWWVCASCEYPAHRDRAAMNGAPMMSLVQ